MKIFSGTSNKELAEKVATKLSLTLSPLEVFIFPDGEKRIQVQEAVLNEECVLVQSTATPADTYYFETFFIVDALKRSGAKSVTLVMPYVGYQRQDHVFRDGEAVSMQVIIKTLEAVGVDKIICFDLHALRIQELFSIPIRHLSALPLFAQKINEENLGGLSSVLASPDMGGIRRIKKMSELLMEMPYITIVKNRDLTTGEVEMVGMDGEIAEKVLIVDDMSSSGKTITKAAALLKEKGAKEIYVYLTHGVFSDEAPKVLQSSVVEKVYVTDSVYIPNDKKFEKLEIISLAQNIAEELRT